MIKIKLALEWFLNRENIEFVETDFWHIKNMKNNLNFDAKIWKIKG